MATETLSGAGGPDEAIPSGLRQRWSRLCLALGSQRLDRVSGLFDQVCSLYATPPRAYHSLRHVADCLHIFDEVRHGAERGGEVEFALWLHDCIYDPRATDNEEHSADAARRVLVALDAPDVDGDRVAQLILATKHGRAAAMPDERLIVDIDLSILGRDPPAYDAYAAAIRREYAFALDTDFRAGRRRFITSMLARGMLFSTPELRARFEAQARRNLQRELSALRD